MSFGAKPMGPPPLRPRPPSRGDTAFAVGSRALITPTGANTATVSLLDEDGMPTQLNLPVDATVVITAWRPRRSAPPRYRVCSADKVEGWIDAANLRRLPPPPPPPPSIVLTPPAPVATKGKSPSAKAAAAPKPAAAKPATKPAPAAPAAKPAAAKVAAPPKPAPKPAAKAAAKPAAKTKARPASAARSKPKAPAGKPKSKRAR
jgi:hypothetical protein